MDDKKQEKRTLIGHPILLSCVSSGFAEICTLPLDTVKVYIQASQPQKIGFYSAVSTIYKSNSNGIMGFYRSSVPCVLRQMTNTGSRLGLYDSYRDWRLKYFAWGGNGKNIGMIEQMAVGGAFGVLGNLLAIPFDVVKTKQQRFPEKGVKKTFNEIVQKEGFRGFYRGLNQTTQRSILISSIQLPLYFNIQRYLNTMNGGGLNTTSKTTIASISTSIVVTAVVYPVDLCKSIVMARTGNNDSGSGSGCGKREKTEKTFIVLKDLIQKDGFRSLYRGVSAGISRAIPHFLITSLCYEHLKKWFS